MPPTAVTNRIKVISEPTFYVKLSQLIIRCCHHVSTSQHPVTWYHQRDLAHSWLAKLA